MRRALLRLQPLVALSVVKAVLPVWLPWLAAPGASHWAVLPPLVPVQLQLKVPLLLLTALAVPVPQRSPVGGTRVATPLAPPQAPLRTALGVAGTLAPEVALPRALVAWTRKV